ncbi:MAG: hypothetical protein ACFFAU_07000 [Candidatus Hodarchaeota archaeon]
MSKLKSSKMFTLRFSDKSTWNEFKEDLKATLRENNIQYQYSEKVPVFHIIYKSELIQIRVAWEEETLLFTLIAKDQISAEEISVCSEIFDLLTLFSGELEEGISPYNW